MVFPLMDARHKSGHDEKTRFRNCNHDNQV
jgi:hypothetical protein